MQRVVGRHKAGWHKAGRHAQAQSGQGLAEFALIIPLLMLIVLGALDIGRVVWSMDAASNAAREAARFAIVRGGSVTFASAATPQAIKDVATAAAVAAGGTPTVFVCYGTTEPTTAVPPASCTSDTNAGLSSYPRGTPITVVVRINVGLVSGSFLGLGQFTVTGSSTMVVHN